MLVQKVMGLDWQSSTKLVIHFGDAPAHGRKYYTSCHDLHPGGDPTGCLCLHQVACCLAASAPCCPNPCISAAEQVNIFVVGPFKT